jgi:hypothetical protein
MDWQLLVVTAFWWWIVGAVLVAAMWWGVMLSRPRVGVRARRPTRWLQGFAFLTAAFAAAFVGITTDYREDRLTVTPEAMATASRLVGALITVTGVYSYGFLRGWPRWWLPR